jgi:CheY-like chemotaxis protein
MNPSPVPSSSLRILYVEDNPLVRDITCELLSLPTRRVVAVASAEEALDVFEPDIFDVVITDISLPAMSGLDLTRRILERVPTTPIIIATGYDLHVDVREWGPRVRFITKPFDPPELEDLLCEVCGDTAGKAAF